MTLISSFLSMPAVLAAMMYGKEIKRFAAFTVRLP